MLADPAIWFSVLYVHRLLPVFLSAARKMPSVVLYISLLPEIMGGASAGLSALVFHFSFPSESQAIIAPFSVPKNITPPLITGDDLVLAPAL
jgi:hypothetical protein